MKAKFLFRTAAMLIAIFAVGHTLGFQQKDSKWGLDSTLAALKTIRFTTQGFSRTYWDFFVGFGLFVTVFLFLAAYLAWQLGSLSGPVLKALRPVAWALTISFALVTVLSWRYFFIAPVVLSSAISLCLVLATLSIRPKN